MACITPGCICLFFWWGPRKSSSKNNRSIWILFIDSLLMKGPKGFSESVSTTQKKGVMQPNTLPSPLPPPSLSLSRHCQRHIGLLVAREFHFCLSLITFLAVSQVSSLFTNIVRTTSSQRATRTRHHLNKQSGRNIVGAGEIELPPHLVRHLRCNRQSPVIAAGLAAGFCGGRVMVFKPATVSCCWFDTRPVVHIFTGLAAHEHSARILLGNMLVCRQKQHLMPVAPPT